MAFSRITSNPVNTDTEGGIESVRINEIEQDISIVKFNIVTLTKAPFRRLCSWKHSKSLNYLDYFIKNRSLLNMARLMPNYSEIDVVLESSTVLSPVFKKERFITAQG